jgi:pimeloyl-ACP methyl ester carboxylesterase
MPDLVVRGVRHFVQRLGRGQSTVVFLHGLVMDNLSSLYFTLAGPVARFADVVLYDLRGHGRSQRPPAGYDLDGLVADLDALLLGLGVRRPVLLVGNSFGGLLALAYAATHPTRVAGMVLVDAHFAGAGWGQAMAETLALEGEERDARIAAGFRTWLGRHRERKRTRLAETAQALVRDTSLVADLRRTPPLDEDRLARLACPILLLYGERSDLRAAGELLARILPAAELRLIAGCTHSVLWEATAEVRGLVARWLAAQAQVDVLETSPDERARP